MILKELKAKFQLQEGLQEFQENSDKESQDFLSEDK